MFNISSTRALDVGFALRKGANGNRPSERRASHGGVEMKVRVRGKPVQFNGRTIEEKTAL